MTDADRGLEVRSISAEETRPVRLRVLRAGLPYETTVWAGDDDGDTAHFGAYVDGELVGVASVVCQDRDQVRRAGSWRLRGMAVTPEYQSRGVGGALLRATFAYADARGCTDYWCNARMVAIPFYERHGLVALGPEFDIPTAGPHRLMERRPGS
ncbi:MAG: GNAT family N-acetyltransferase [Myxococcales bacterium]|nr:GNAT family N-acetyltransferase [Myxococcales bacterium]MCB9530817.1 GNAT family N-acetyltransferase [Myxococcales bacterium]